jgi:hypothetical protein
VNQSAANVTNSHLFRGDGVAVMFTRGACLFSAMVEAASLGGAAAVFIVNAGNRTAVIPGGSNYSSFQGTVCMLDAAAGRAVTNSSVITVYYPEFAVLDASASIFLVVALGVLVIGSSWNTHNERERLRQRGSRQGGSINAGGAPERSEDQQLMTKGTILFFIVFASGFLLLLYFFYKYLIYLLLVGFGLFGALSNYEHVSALLSQTAAWRKTVDLPYSPKTPWLALVIIAGSLGLSIAWGFTRSEDYSWVLQDILGISILITMIRVVTIPNLKIATGLLCVLLLYDVFFVFITPYITADGSSVMVNAATGNQTQVDDNGCESYSNMMPFLLRVPALSRPACSCPHYSMLGFGDIALPGFVVAMTLRFDYALVINGAKPRTFLKRYSYFLTTLTAYLLGLISAFVAASQMEMAQPALLYLSPAVLLSIWIPGWFRGHLTQLKDLEGFLGYLPPRATSANSQRSESTDGDESRDRLLDDNDSDSA